MYVAKNVNMLAIVVVNILAICAMIAVEINVAPFCRNKITLIYKSKIWQN